MTRYLTKLLQKYANVKCSMEFVSGQKQTKQLPPSHKSHFSCGPNVIIATSAFCHCLYMHSSFTHVIFVILLSVNVVDWTVSAIAFVVESLQYYICLLVFRFWF